MLKNQKVIVSMLIGVLVATALIVTVMINTGGQLDTVAVNATESFAQMINTVPSLLTRDGNGHWNITAPDGSARFILGAEGNYVALAWDAKPFIAAGLAVEKLPDAYTLNGEELVYTMGVAGDGSKEQAGTAALAMQTLTKTMPDAIGYHIPMDHFGVMVGEAGMFEWAQSLETLTDTGEPQEKDIVFVLSPDALIEAGVEPALVEGWVYAPVEVMDGGATLFVEKFLKPFNIA